MFFCFSPHVYVLRSWSSLLLNMPSVLNSPRSRLSTFLFLLIMLVPTPHDSGVYFLMLLSIGATATPRLALDAACVGLVLLRQFAPCVLLLPSSAHPLAPTASLLPHQSHGVWCEQQAKTGAGWMANGFLRLLLLLLLLLLANNTHVQKHSHTLAHTHRRHPQGSAHQFTRRNGNNLHAISLSRSLFC